MPNCSASRNVPFRLIADSNPTFRVLFLRGCLDWRTTVIRECFLKGMLELMESCTREALCA